MSKYKPIIATIVGGVLLSGMMVATPAQAATFPTPDSVSSSTKATEVGVEFKAQKAATVTGVSFFKAGKNNATTVAVWDPATNRRVATGVVKDTSATGWVDVQLSKPLTLTAGKTYVASYYTSKGNYSVENNEYLLSKTDGYITYPADAGVLSVNGKAPVDVAGTDGYGVRVLFDGQSEPTYPTLPYPTPVPTSPTTVPTSEPTITPTVTPTVAPTVTPTVAPTVAPGSVVSAGPVKNLKATPTTTAAKVVWQHADVTGTLVRYSVTVTNSTGYIRTFYTKTTTVTFTGLPSGTEHRFIVNTEAVSADGTKKASTATATTAKTLGTAPVVKPSPTPTSQPGTTPTPDPTATATPTPTPTATATPAPTPTATATPAPTPTATATPAPGSVATAAPVTNLVATAVRVNWNHSVITGTLVRYSITISNDSGYTKTFYSKADTVTFTGLTTGTTYRVAVVTEVVSTDGTKKATATALTTTKTAGTAPVTPTPAPTSPASTPAPSPTATPTPTPTQPVPANIPVNVAIIGDSNSNGNNIDRTLLAGVRTSHRTTVTSPSLVVGLTAVRTLQQSQLTPLQFRTLMSQPSWLEQTTSQLESTKLTCHAT
jgi:hypothetical protein